MPAADTNRVRARLGLLAQILSLLATGWFLWGASLAARLERQSLAALIGLALPYALLAWAWSVAITFGLCLLLLRSDRAGALDSALRTSAAAVWFAPATILLSAFSPAALAAALVLVITATRLLCSEWPLLEPANGRPRAFLSRQMFAGLAVSSAVQAGVVAFLMDYPLLAAALFALGTAVLTALSTVAGVWDLEKPRNLPPSFLSIALTILLAAGLTVGGVQVRYESGPHPGLGFDSRGRPGVAKTTRALLRHFFHGYQGDEPKGGTKRVVTRLYRPPSDLLNLPAKGFPGVILSPEAQAHVTLVAPLPAGRGTGGTALAQPMSIPFTGEYWMFRQPYIQPPLDSITRRASPLDLSFTTTDGRPLEMEAHQKLDPPIEISCCGEVRLAIASSDRYPGTVSLEVILLDAEFPGARSESLGRSLAGLKPDLAGREILDFAVPSLPVLQKFNEIKVVFHRDRVRIDKSARIEIDRFIFVPRSR